MANVIVGNAGKNQPEMVENGLNVAICHVSLSLTLSAGDVHLIGKLPNGAIPIDAVFYPGASLAAGHIAKFGTSASQELFFASQSYSTAYRSTRKLGPSMQISLSDDARVNYEWITMVASGGMTIGTIGDLIVEYKMPGQVL